MSQASDGTDHESAPSVDDYMEAFRALFNDQQEIDVGRDAVTAFVSAIRREVPSRNVELPPLDWQPLFSDQRAIDAGRDDVLASVGTGDVPVVTIANQWPPPWMSRPVERAEVAMNTSVISGIPAVCRAPLSTEGPIADIRWMRQATNIRSGPFNGMEIFGGNYLYPPANSTRYLLIPGEVVIVASGPEMEDTATPRPVQRNLQAYVFLPEHIWYPIPDTAMRQRSGWHETMRDLLRPWLLVGRASRILTAVTAMRLALQAYIAQINANDIDPSWEYSLQQCARIRQVILTPEVTESIAPDTRREVLVRWEAWIAAMAIHHSIETQDVMAILREELELQSDTNTSQLTLAAPSKTTRRLENRQQRNIRIDRNCK